MDIIENDSCPLAHGFFRSEGGVGSYNCIFCVKERMVRRDWRLRFKDVNAGAGNFSFVQGLCQSRGIDNRSACFVNEIRRRFHIRQAFGINDMA